MRAFAMFLTALGYLAAFLGAWLGVFELLSTSLHAESAPQQAAGAAMAVAYAIIPYVGARALAGLVLLEDTGNLVKEVRAQSNALRELTSARSAAREVKAA